MQDKHYVVMIQFYHGKMLRNSIIDSVIIVQRLYAAWRKFYPSFL